MSTAGPLGTHLQRLLAYHGWAYQRLLTHCSELDDADYRRPCGLFFGSLHSTLNHMAVADRLWLARVLGEPQPFDRLDAETAPDLPALSHYLAEGVDGWQRWLADRSDTELGQTLYYQSVTNGAQQRMLADIVSHLVNHGSHHRGQASAALTAMGRPAPVLDYIYFTPELACR
ncbi:DinB family protein [Zestomonas carbonaria]|uniref:Damage-inducible protein DinB n=1 Tax=Zestomonas carbonaria TaxID=2762745 RepID=A0A7U7EMY0_9GAMM|nr:DinB family protein [Pseudomonas carbonaria]CAD5107593.1 hypothetical protein PSEWESI4_01866 [Pseudomonas carbonaria]